MTRITLPRLTLTFGLALLGMTSGLPATAAEPALTFDLVRSKWTVTPKGSAIVDSEIALRIPQNSSLKIVQMPLSWSRSLETLEVTRARVEKKGGRVVFFGKEAIRELPPPGDLLYREFLDTRRLIVTLFDVEAGDLIVLNTRRDVFRPRVPGGFATVSVLGRATISDELEQAISVPANLSLQVENRGFEYQSEVSGDRTIHYLRSRKNTASSAPEVAAVGQYDRAPRFALSSFKDWDSFAQGYASLLMPRAAVTPAIKARAMQLTEGRNEARDQARLLYEWVRDNIRHVPVALDESRPDPHDAETVLTNLYGDDKDHAVLLLALLAARGIPAEAVLVNNTDSATLAGPPNLQPLNHLILHLPEQNVYLDSTLGVAPFGVLSFQVLGKPAIHLGGKGPARGFIPVPAGDSSRADSRTVATLTADGEVSGATVTTARGAFGVQLRQIARSFGAGEKRKTAATAVLKRHGTPGKGDFSLDPPAAAGDEYSVTGTFRLDDKAKVLDGGYFTLLTGLRLLPRAGDFLEGPLFLKGLAPDAAVFCYPGTQREELSVIIPAGRELSTLPPDTVIETELGRFHSHWALDGQRVTVVREFVSSASGPVCEGPVREQIADMQEKIRADYFNKVGITRVSFPTAEPEPAADPKETRGTRRP